jgi:uncharacterized protein DUF3352
VFVEINRPSPVRNNLVAGEGTGRKEIFIQKEIFMQNREHAKWLVAWLTVFVLLAAPLTTLQARAAYATEDFESYRQDKADDEAVTFDNLIGAESYLLYVEVRNVGQQVRPGGLAELLEPLLPLLGQGAMETGLISFINANAGLLARSRMMFAAMPTKPSMPQAVVAIEMASAEAAREFEPKFREFVTSLIPASAMAQSAASQASNSDPTSRPKHATAPTSFSVRQVGNLVLISDPSFTVQSVKADSKKLLSEDAAFRAARDRFYSEPLFIYYDLALGERYTQQFVTPQSEAVRSDESPGPVLDHDIKVPTQSEEAGAVAVVKQQSRPAPLKAAIGVEETSKPTAGKTSRSSQSGARSRKQTKASAAATTSANTQRDKSRKEPAQSQAGDVALLEGAVEQPRGSEMASIFMRLLFNGPTAESKSPDALAIAVAPEGDEIIARLLLVSDFGDPVRAIPFISSLICGPPLLPEAATVLPSDTEIFVSASVDFARMYDVILQMARATEKNNKAKAATDSRIAAIEKKYGFKIKEELLASLGGEVALSLPASWLFGLAERGPSALGAQAPRGDSILLVSVQNKEAFAPKVALALEALGLKAAAEKGVVEKLGDFEIRSYNKVAVTFINNFLVLAPDPASLRRIVEAYKANKTLASSREFHSYTRWQPRQTLAQIYASSAVMKGMLDDLKKSAEGKGEHVREALSRLNFDPEPITYAASTESIGPLYELHLPKNLITMLFAELNAEMSHGRGPASEMAIQDALRFLNEMQSDYQEEHKKYATLEELGGDAAYFKPLFEALGYKFDFALGGGGYEATATPLEYGKSGKLSFYTDQNGVIRAADHEGRPATAADKIVERKQGKEDH